MKTNNLIVDKATNTVTYGNKKYRVQNDRGNLHIIVRVNGERTKLTVKKPVEYPYNVFFHYYLSGLSETNHCRVMDWWLELKYKPKL